MYTVNMYFHLRFSRKTIFFFNFISNLVPWRGKGIVVRYLPFRNKMYPACGETYLGFTSHMYMYMYIALNPAKKP